LSPEALMDMAVDGAEHAVKAECTVEQLPKELGLNPAGVAVAVNRTVGPRSVRPSRALQAFDSVEIIQAVGGG
jgi:thiamine biosynthesis protein ThiS